MLPPTMEVGQPTFNFVINALMVPPTGSWFTLNYPPTQISSSTNSTGSSAASYLLPHHRGTDTIFFMEGGSKPSQQRGPAFSMDEDKLLCVTWLEISQDPVKGVNQKKDQLWQRISTTFHERRPSNYTIARTPKSLKCRMNLISKAISKFRGCVRAIENLNPSGASEMDILEKAKELFSQDVEEKKGFQYEHVWPILKEAEKWLDVPNLKRQGYEHPEIESLGEASSVEFKTVEDFQQSDYDVDSNGRPVGRKKEKMRRKQMVENSSVLQSIVEVNQEILANMKAGQKQREERMSKMEGLMMLQAENERAKLKLEQQRQEKEFMEKDLNTIEDPSDREYFRKKKMEISDNRAQAHNTFWASIEDDFNFSQHQNNDLADY